MISSIIFQIPILLLLLIGAYQDYKTRTVSNKIILAITILSIPLIVNNKEFILPIIICTIFIILFYVSDYIPAGSIFANPIGGADAKVFIPLLLQMSTYNIFIFFFLLSIGYFIVFLKFHRNIPLFIPILFGYFGLVTISLLQIVIRIISDAYP